MKIIFHKPKRNKNSQLYVDQRGELRRPKLCFRLYSKYSMLTYCLAGQRGQTYLQFKQEKSFWFFTIEFWRYVPNRDLPENFTLKDCEIFPRWSSLKGNPPILASLAYKDPYLDNWFAFLSTRNSNQKTFFPWAHK